MAMTYDAENRMKSAEYTDSAVTPAVVRKTEYVYVGDSLVAEMRKYDGGVLASTTKYLRAGFLPVQERDASNAVTREYTWGLNMGGGIDGLLNLRQGGQNYAYLYDGKGNVASLIDGSQALVANYRYDPFGVLLKKVASIDQPYMFSTKEYDPKTGLYYHGFRFRDPILGPWTTRDPKGEVGGWNLYANGNNSINYIDPFGLWLTSGHNEIIDAFVTKYFPTLEPEFATAMKEGSFYADKFQAAKYSFLHHMTNGSKRQSKEEAARLMNNFIADHLNSYECNLARGNKKQAFKELGMALHPVMDSTAPPHARFQPWFDSYPGLFLLVHGAREMRGPDAHTVDTTVDRMIRTLNTKGK